MTTDTTYYFRTYFKCGSALPTANAAVLRCLGDTGFTVGVASVLLLTTGKFRTLNAALGTIGTATNAALTVDTWYRLEWVLRVNSAGGTTSTSQLYLDGTQILTSTTANLGSAPPRVIATATSVAAPGGTTAFYYDDVAMDNAALPGPGKIALLTPTSDNAKSPTGSAGWKGGGGGTTNLYQGVDNVPPLAVAGTDATEIADSDNSSTDTYDANLATYASAGIQAADRVALTQALAQGSNVNATLRTIAVVQQSNPGPGTKGTLSVDTVAKVVRDTAQIDPSVTLGSPPVVRVSKDVATADTLFYELVGLYVEYVGLSTTAADTATASESLSVEPGVVTGDTVTASESTSAEPGLGQGDSVAASDSLSVEAGVARSDSVSPADSLAVGPEVALSDSTTVSDTTNAGTEVAAADAVAASDSLAVDVSIVTADSVSASEGLAAYVGLALDLADSVTASDSLSSELTVGEETPTAFIGGRAREPLRWEQTLSDDVLVRDEIALQFSEVEQHAFVLRDAARTNDRLACGTERRIASVVGTTESLGKHSAAIRSDALTATDTLGSTLTVTNESDSQEVEEELLLLLS